MLKDEFDCTVRFSLSVFLETSARRKLFERRILSEPAKRLDSAVDNASLNQRHNDADDRQHQPPHRMYPRTFSSSHISDKYLPFAHMAIAPLCSPPQIIARSRRRFAERADLRVCFDDYRELIRLEDFNFHLSS
jgi:hypothetical protein